MILDENLRPIDTKLVRDVRPGDRILAKNGEYAEVDGVQDEGGDEYSIDYEDGSVSVLDGGEQVTYLVDRKHTYTVTVIGCNERDARQVMTERLGVDENYGFDYTIDWE